MRVIAELGLNTNGSLETALRMVEAVAEAGCDGIKVQAYDPADFLPAGHPDWDMFDRNRLSWDELADVGAAAAAAGLEFGATPTSLEGVGLLADLGVDFLKNGSDYLLRRDMIQAMLDTGIETWVSTGMAEAEELFWLYDTPAKLMACTSVYPCPDDQANLLRVFSPRFHGYSDHTDSGSIAAVMACAYGAEMYETHFTLSRRQDGPDHWFSKSPASMALLVADVRRAEKLRGTLTQQPTRGELTGRGKWRVTETSLRQ